jgi:hypothetical protein
MRSEVLAPTLADDHRVIAAFDIGTRVRSPTYLASGRSRYVPQKQTERRCGTKQVYPAKHEPGNRAS